MTEEDTTIEDIPAETGERSTISRRCYYIEMDVQPTAIARVELFQYRDTAVDYVHGGEEECYSWKQEKTDSP